jgi:hypothetical protein
MGRPGPQQDLEDDAAEYHLLGEAGIDVGRRHPSKPAGTLDVQITELEERDQVE